MEPGRFASALNLFGIPVTGAEVAATGDFWYDTVAGALNEPMIFGPSFRGVEWTEAIQNEGDFTNWGVYGDVAYHLSERLDVIGGLRYSEDEKGVLVAVSSDQLRRAAPRREQPDLHARSAVCLGIHHAAREQ